MVKDVEWRYYPESDDLAIFFVGQDPLICWSDQVAEHIVVDYDDFNKLMSVDINAASDILPPCRFSSEGEGGTDPAQLPRFCVTQQADGVHDELTIAFMDAKTSVTSEQHTDDERVVLGLDAAGKLACITVRMASSSIAAP